jgi:hypothetical protein
MIGGSQQLKFRETYAKSVKTGQSGLENRIIRFFQTQHIDKETYTIHLRYSLTAYLGIHKTYSNINSLKCIKEVQSITSHIT